MKNKTILTLLIGFAMLITNPVMAAEVTDVDHTEHHKEATVEVEGIVSLEASYTALQTAISNNSFDQIHEIVEGMESNLNGVKESHKDDASITGTVDTLLKVLEDLHNAGDAKDAAKAQVDLKKLDGGLKLLKARL